MAQRPRRTRAEPVQYAETSDLEPELLFRRNKKPPAKPKHKSARSPLTGSSSLSSLGDDEDGKPLPLGEALMLRAGEDPSGLVRQVVVSSERVHRTSYHTSHISLPEYRPAVPNKSRNKPSANQNDRDEEKHLSNVPPELEALQASLLKWYDDVKENREMPWRKELKEGQTLTNHQKGQRAYEVWVSEIMLQQTQVETVKAYYLRWMNRFPTIFDLAKSNIELVNECWQGLGYYSRASRLLSGAKKVVQRFEGILPEDPLVMEKEVDGIGPYSAGAIASIAYAKPVPMIDGNVHRVLARLTALHAPQAAKSTTNFLWSVAANLVPRRRPGDFNQALMELGATVCKPREACCSICPLSKWCRAFQESQALRSSDNPGNRAGHLIGQTVDIEDACSLCHPFDPSQASSSSSTDHILIYPMAKERKKPTVREVAVGVVEWQPTMTTSSGDSVKEPRLPAGQSIVLLIKRPEKGLLAGLWEFPSIDLPENHSLTASSRLSQIESLLQKILVGPVPSLACSAAASMKKEPPASPDSCLATRVTSRDLPDIQHIFSHIRMTYKSTSIILRSAEPPTLTNPSPDARPTESGQAKWVPSSEVMKSNIGNPHKKVWKCLVDFNAHLNEPGRKRKCDDGDENSSVKK